MLVPPLLTAHALDIANLHAKRLIANFLSTFRIAGLVKYTLASVLFINRKDDKHIKGVYSARVDMQIVLLSRGAFKEGKFFVEAKLLLFFLFFAIFLCWQSEKKKPIDDIRACSPGGASYIKLTARLCIATALSSLLQSANVLKH